MKSPTRKEAAALAKLDEIGRAEMNREQWWHMLPIVDRERALSIAGLLRERAAMPLATFSDAERARVRWAISSHITNMGLIAQCMNAHNTNVQGWLH